MNYIPLLFAVALAAGLALLASMILHRRVNEWRDAVLDALAARGAYFPPEAHPRLAVSRLIELIEPTPVSNNLVVYAGDGFSTPVVKPASPLFKLSFRGGGTTHFRDDKVGRYVLREDLGAIQALKLSQSHVDKDGDTWERVS